MTRGPGLESMGASAGQRDPLAIAGAAATVTLSHPAKRHGTDRAPLDVLGACFERSPPFRGA